MYKYIGEMFREVFSCYLLVDILILQVFRFCQAGWRGVSVWHNLDPSSWLFAHCHSNGMVSSFY